MPRRTPHAAVFKRRAPQARRDAILAASRAILDRKDFHEMRMDDVARRAGVAKGALYPYFPTKERLFGALDKDMFEQVRQRWQRLARETAPGEERLKAAIRSQFEFFEHNRGIFLQVVQGSFPCGGDAPKRS